MSFKNNPSFAVVLPAGGLGKRFSSSLPKQLHLLKDKPLYTYSLKTFLSIPEIIELVLVVPAEWESHFEKVLLEDNKILSESEQNKVKIVLGGKERFDSVKNGVLAIERASHVLIHDVARPLVSERIIHDCFAVLREDFACVVAKPVTDTVKVVSDSFVKKTLDRDLLWLAQTPQACKLSTLKDLYQKIEEKPLSFLPTDEASILEFFEIPVKVVMGESKNDKLTHPEDWNRFL